MRFGAPGGGYGRGPGPAVRTIVIICVAVFLLAQVMPELIVRFGLIPAFVWRRGYVWELVTYIFVHFQLWHLVLNLFIFWMFGSDLESRWGSKYFVKYFLITGIGAGALSAVADPASHVPIVGASGSIYGLLLAQAVLYPNRTVLFMFFLPMAMKHFVWFLIAMEFMAQLSGSSPGIAHLAHLGGIGVGYLYLKKDDLYRRWRNRYYRRKLERLERDRAQEEW